MSFEMPACSHGSPPVNLGRKPASARCLDGADVATLALTPFNGKEFQASCSAN
jgi:hypothetical protein